MNPFYVVKGSSCIVCRSKPSTSRWEGPAIRTSIKYFKVADRIYLLQCYKAARVSFNELESLGCLPIYQVSRPREPDEPQFRSGAIE